MLCIYCITLYKKHEVRYHFSTFHLTSLYSNTSRPIYSVVHYKEKGTSRFAESYCGTKLIIQIN